MCPCQSSKKYQDCCKPYYSSISFVSRDDNQFEENGAYESLLIGWTRKYGPATSESFYKKTKSYVFRMSQYLDDIVDTYLDLRFPSTKEVKEITHEAFLV